MAARRPVGVGVFFWLVIGTLIFGRLFTGAPLPAPIRPSLSVLVSPPAVAGIAWHIIAGGRMDTIGYLLLGTLLMMLLIQVLASSQYRTLTFSPNFWAFTFPIAASTNFVIRWIDSARFPYWHTWTWLLTGIATSFIAALATATIATALTHHGRAAPAGWPRPGRG